ncbi:MAG: hypothetical protein ACYCP0_04300 [Acidiferrobacteraceae bacterium]
MSAVCKPTPQRLLTSEIKALLRARYSAPEWALLFEVGNATGVQQRRWADAVAMSLWPSRGLAIHGFEIKVSRRDWVKELKSPEKSAPVQEYCDHWWIVAPEGVLREGELPPTWGLLTATRDQLAIATPAATLPAQPVDRSFLAALLRRASEADESLVQAAVELQREKVQQQCQQIAASEIENRTHRFTEIRKQLQEIQERTGIDLLRGGTPSDEVAEAIRWALNGRMFPRYIGLSTVRKDLENALEKVNTALDAFLSQGKTVLQPPPAPGAEE